MTTEGEEPTHQGMAGPRVTGATRSSRTSRIHAQPVSLNPGEKVGRYVLLDELGVGGMGVVYAAWDPELVLLEGLAP